MPSYHLVVGAAGAVGKKLIQGLCSRGNVVFAGLRKTPLPDHLQIQVAGQKLGVDVKNPEIMAKLFQASEIQLGTVAKGTVANQVTVWNLAAPLSVDAALDPSLSERTTVGGMENILNSMVNAESKRFNFSKMMFTDSIGSFGTSSPRTNCSARWLTENPTQDPGSDYGMHKRGCRNMMSKFAQSHQVDTRFAVLPGVLHTEADWGNGTTEYALDALKAAVMQEVDDGASLPYVLPIDPEVQLPMVFADDLIEGLIAMSDASPDELQEPERGYCVPGFSFCAEELFAEIRKHYPNFEVQYGPVNEHMNKFAHTWPEALSIKEAERDFKYKPRFGLKETVEAILKAHQRRMAVGASPPEDSSISVAW